MQIFANDGLHYAAPWWAELSENVRLNLYGTAWDSLSRHTTERVDVILFGNLRLDSDVSFHVP